MPARRPSDAPALNQPLLAEHERSYTPTPQTYPASTSNPRQTSSSDESGGLEATRYSSTAGHEDDVEEEEEEDMETLGMTGFQRPDGNEISAMVVSGTVVVLLSIAAGLTTIFDWVI